MLTESDTLSGRGVSLSRGVVILVALIASSAAVLVGLANGLLALAALTVLLALALSPTTGWSTAVIVAVLGAVTLAYAVAVTAPTIGIRLGPALAVVTLAGTLWWIVQPASGLGSDAWRQRFTVRSAAPWPARRATLVVGAIPGLWVLVVALSFLVPGASAHDWALNGDSANNVLFSKDIAIAQGLRLVSENPVPLPHLLIALGMPDGAVPTTADLSAYVWVWHACIAATACLAGLLGYRVATDRGLRAGQVAVSTLAPAVVIVSWLVTGYATAFGFVNVHVALAVVLASLALSHGSVSPAVAVWGHVCGAILLVLTWSPLAVIPAVLCVGPLVGLLRRSARRTDRLWATGAVVAGVVFMVARYRSSARGLTDAVSSQAAVLAPSPRTLAVVIVVAAVSGAVLYARDRSLAMSVWLVTGAVAAVVSAMAWIVGAWTYYPMKMSWFAAVILLVVASAYLPRSLVALAGDRGRLIPWLAASAVAVAVVVPPLAASGQPRAAWLHDPLTTILAPQDAGDQVFDAMKDLERNESDLLWESGWPVERQVDFWTISLRSGVFHPVSQADERFALRALAYSQFAPADQQVCDLAASWGGPLRVVTGEETVAHRLVDRCGTANLEVFVAGN